MSASESESNSADSQGAGLSRQGRRQARRTKVERRTRSTAFRQFRKDARSKAVSGSMKRTVTVGRRSATMTIPVCTSVKDVINDLAGLLAADPAPDAKDAKEAM